MRLACIDIGSNTTRLLVADADGLRLREVASERVFTRLRGFTSAVPPEKVAELAATVAAQVRQAREVGAEEITVVATAAMRAAANAEDVCAGISALAGVPVEVLSPDDEARLAFLGATSVLDETPSGPVAVVDVGGASSELVCGTVAEGVTWATSLAIGSGTLADACFERDPPSQADLARARGRVEDTFSRLAPPPAMAAFAVGGSATSLTRLVGPLLDLGTLEGASRRVCSAPAAEMAARLDMHAERVRVLPAGMLVLQAACASLALPLRIACGGLREGVVLERSGARSCGPS